MIRLYWNLSSVLFILILNSISSCRSTATADSSARVIVRAFEDFERSRGSDRVSALEHFRSISCKTNEICLDRDLCVKYASALLRAEDLTRRARALSPADAGGNGAATIDELREIIHGAESAVNEAEQAHPACNQALHRLYEQANRH